MKILGEVKKDLRYGDQSRQEYMRLRLS